MTIFISHHIYTLRAGEAQRGSTETATSREGVRGRWGQCQGDFGEIKKGFGT